MEGEDASCEGTTTRPARAPAATESISAPHFFEAATGESRAESLSLRVVCALLGGDHMRVLILISCLWVTACGRAGLSHELDGGPGGGGGTGGGTGGDAGGGTGGGGLGGGGGFGGGAGGGAASCAGLTADACRARTDCAADFCLICTCTPRYQGCRRVSESPAICPEVKCVQPLCCGSHVACQPSETCVPQGTPQGCGACDITPGTCTLDQDCIAFPSVQICEPIACSCTGQRHCVSGCGPSSPCPQGSTCNGTTGRCQALQCTSGANCPLTFNCSAGACVRKVCTADAQCGDGFCVNGGCYEGLGECRLRVQ